MAFPIRRQQDAAQVRVIAEGHAEEIEDFALHPIRRRPDARHALDAALLIRRHLQTHALVRADRVEIIDHIEGRFRTIWKMHAR